jgi:hypothetical protein
MHPTKGKANTSTDKTSAQSRTAANTKVSTESTQIQAQSRQIGPGLLGKRHPTRSKRGTTQNRRDEKGNERRGGDLGEATT